MSEKPKTDAASFLIVWAYLMVAAVALAPVAAFLLIGDKP